VKVKYIHITGFLVLALSVFSCSQESKPKIGFMENARVFEEFEMKKDYDNRIEEDMSLEVKFMDSLELVIDQVIESGDSLKVLRLKKQYFAVEQKYRQKFDENSSRYTQEVNDRLNEYVEKYAEQEGLDFILGSYGQGNLMYENDSKNISDDLIKYINSMYHK